MVTTQDLIELVREAVLPPDEAVTWAKEFPDGPAVSVRTAERILFAQTTDDWSVGRAPWVAAVVVVTREDEDTHGPPSRRMFLLLDDGSPLDLDDPRQVAGLGRALRDDGLDPLAYAEILIERHWPGPGPRAVVTDPREWRAALPAGAPEPPPVQAPRVFDDEHGDRWVAFHAARQDPDAAGPEVTLWSVRVPPTGPATWLRRPAAYS
ncbi:hypothetical protein [Virgisporangium ochraceum]|uniref:Uncharacterized protein n=1 Tax=Virgisporangium ochraceum TaxID=65505 RepID=A0A8J3ZUS4_9ACTN|nr:hypothetical protein [Virgisporangium ochraceum]GIJ67880.1 hypothetical protein Voc01_027970 [Virgisporangium ochraceum]